MQSQQFLLFLLQPGVEVSVQAHFLVKTNWELWVGLWAAFAYLVDFLAIFVCLF